MHLAERVMRTMMLNSLLKATAAFCMATVLVTGTCILVPRSGAKQTNTVEQPALVPPGFNGVPRTARKIAGSKEKLKANLLVNGSFEDGIDISEVKYLPLNKGSKDIKGWEVTRGQIDYEGLSWQHADGERSIDLHGSPGFGGIKQTFKTRKGQKYRLTFFMAGNPNGLVPVKKMGVEVADKKEEFSFDTQGKKLIDMGWTSHTLDFTATDVQTTLEFYTLMSEDDWCGPALDNVSVVAVKE
jgi:choice-of-anchor C domain-containing protein